MKILYFVIFGQDKSHLWETNIFKRLKDAKQFVKDLPSTAIGGGNVI